MVDRIHEALGADEIAAWLALGKIEGQQRAIHLAAVIAGIATLMHDDRRQPFGMLGLQALDLVGEGVMVGVQSGVQ